MVKLRYTKQIYKVKPSASIRSALERQLKLSNFLWNLAVDYYHERYQEAQNCVGTTTLIGELSKWREQYPFLKESVCQVQQYTLAEVAELVWEPFKNLEPQAFPQKRNKASLGFLHYTQSFEYDRCGRCVKLPKIGWISFISPELPPIFIQSATVFLTKDGWELILVPKILQTPEEIAESRKREILQRKIKQNRLVPTKPFKPIDNLVVGVPKVGLTKNPTTMTEDK